MLPDITGDITLLGGQKTTLSRDTGSGPFRILNVAGGGEFHVDSVTIMNGNTAGLGSGIQNAGSLTLTNVKLKDNTAGNGGGVANTTGAFATVSDSAFQKTPRPASGAVASSTRAT